MRFLLTNDDGIHAPGLAALECALARFATRALVLAPDQHLSGCSHRTTTDRALEMTQLQEDRLQLSGTPADCARVAVAHLFPTLDWVVSGINDGGNLGADIYVSGTVAAAREAALLGKPSIAISQYRRRGSKINWQRAAHHAERVLALLFDRPQQPGTFWNVNLPDCDLGEGELPEIVFCQLDTNPLPVSFSEHQGRLLYHGVYHERARQAGRDVDVCFSGRIAVTSLSLA